MEDEKNPYSTISLRLVLMTGSYLGEVVVKNLVADGRRLKPQAGMFV